MATIVKRRIGDGSTRYVVDYRDLGGRRRKERFKRERDARLRLAEVVAQHSDGTLRARADDVKFSALVDDWRLVRWPSLRESSRSIYSWLLDAWLIPELGGRKLRTITLRDCEQLHAKVRSAVAESERAKGGRATANMALGLLKQILSYAEAHRYVAASPARHAKTQPAPFEERRQRIDGNVLGADELRRLFDAADASWRPLIMTAALTGLRRGELLGLQWGDVDWASGRVHVRRQMTGGKLSAPKTPAALRRVPLPAELVSELRPWRLRCPKGELDLVFPDGEGGPLHHSSVDKCGLGPALRRAGLRRVTLHSLRHGYASALIGSGASVKVVQRLMGHSNVQMTLQTYAHMMPGDDDGIAATLSARVFGGRSGNFLDTSGERREETHGGTRG
jgi:integrase